MKKKYLSLILALGVLLVSAVPALANQDRPQKTVIVSEDQTIEGNYYNVGDLVEILGTVNGDVYVFGGQVIVSGTVNGDLITAGGSVTINGEVTEDVRVAGGQVYLDSKVGDDLSVAGGNVEISKNAHIGGGLQAAGGNVILSGSVENEAYLAAGNLTLTGSGVIGGDLNYAAGEESQISQEATVKGTQNRYDSTKYNLNVSPQETMNSISRAFSAISKLVSITTTTVLALLLIFLFPNFSKKGKEIVLKNVVKAAGIGFLTLIVSPVIFILIAITLLGIPLAFLFGTIVFWFAYIGRVLVMLAIGDKIVGLYKKTSALWLSFLIGAIVYYLITPLPIIGGILKFIALLIGTGAILITKHRVTKEALKAKII